MELFMTLILLWVIYHGCSISLNEQKEFWKRYLYDHFYVPNRSFISLYIFRPLYVYIHFVFTLRFPNNLSSFTCDVCQLRLGGQDLDIEYEQNCQCDDLIDFKTCQSCIRIDLMNQVGDQRASTLHCLGRKCNLDDRFVRHRLDSQGILHLDRNQIDHAVRSAAVSAASNSTNSSTNGRFESEEKLWRCPSPDCHFVAFLPNNISPKPPYQSYLNKLYRKIKGSTKQSSLSDPRKVSCPACQITSCQFCNMAWSKGVAEHEYLTCEKYCILLDSDDQSGTKSFHKWINDGTTRNLVQTCPKCTTVIEKNEGCIHMTCRSCRYEFCWICNDQWTNGHSYFCRRYHRRRVQNRNINNDTVGGALSTTSTSWFEFFFG